LLEKLLLTFANNYISVSVIIPHSQENKLKISNNQKQLTQNSTNCN